MKKLPPENKHEEAETAAQNFHDSVYEENLGEDHAYPDFNKAAFSWIAPEYLQHPKSVRWWVGAGIIVVIAVILEAITGNWTMLVATLAFALVFYITHQYHPPKHTKINLSELGVKIGHRRLAYEEIEFFWIIYNPPEVKRLFLRVKDSLLPDLVIELEDQDPQAIRSFLEHYLVEVTGVKEHLSDQLLRLFKL